MDKKTGRCLASQEIRELIKTGRLLAESAESEDSLESRIQPSSFDACIGNEIFVLDTEVRGLFRPNMKEPVYRTLLQLPGRQRRKVDISKGFELKKGFTYLIPLDTKVRLYEGGCVKSSPKSSFGRLFLNTRLLSDYNPCFDEINYKYCVDKDLLLWLFVQPLAFNIMAYPGLALNQLRFINGYDAKISASELLDEVAVNPLLFHKDSDGLLIPANHIISDGLDIHLDLVGKYTAGIVGLRARHNPVPIDLNKKGEYSAEEFFEPVKAQGNVTIKNGDYYLLASSEILKIPPHLNVEMRPHSHLGFYGPLHFAGFVDNGFVGDLVFEIRSDELSSIELEHGMPVSKLDVFRTEVPDKLYGAEIGSHYQGQVGPKASKFFKVFDFAHAARNYQKLDRLVLVQDSRILNACRKKDALNAKRSAEKSYVLKDNAPFQFIDSLDVGRLFESIGNGFFQSRYDCEYDELVLQIIPYVVLFGPDNCIFSYVRAKDIKDYGDERLFGKHSLGLGGHIIQADAPDFVGNCIKREVFEEVVIHGAYSEPLLAGAIMAYDMPVDRVHFGLVFVGHVNEIIAPKESSIISGRMVSIDDVLDDPGIDKYETWSRGLIPHLKKLNKL